MGVQALNKERRTIWSRVRQPPLLIRTILYAIERHRLLHELSQNIRKMDELNKTLEERVRERTQSLFHYQQQLQIMTSKLTLSEQNERRRLARLHDYLAQPGHYQDETGTVQPYPANGSATEHLKDIDHLLEQSLKYTRT